MGQRSIIEVAERAGLRLDADGHIASGTVDGHVVWCHRGIIHTEDVSYIRLALRPELDLSPGHRADRLLFAFGAAEYGAPKQDIYAQSDERASSLLRGALLTAGPLYEIAVRCQQTQIWDDEICLACDDAMDADALVDILRLAIVAVREIDERRANVPVRRELERWVVPVERLAAGMNLKTTSCPLGAVGVLDDIAVRAFFCARDGNFRLAIETDLPHTSGFVVRATPRRRTLLDRMHLTRTHGERIGVREIDEALAFSTNDLDELRARLGPPELEDMQALVDAGSLTISGARLRLLGGRLGEADALIRRAARVASALSGPSADDVHPFR